MRRVGQTTPRVRGITSLSEQRTDGPRTARHMRSWVISDEGFGPGALVIVPACSRRRSPTSAARCLLRPSGGAGVVIPPSDSRNTVGPGSHPKRFGDAVAGRSRSRARSAAASSDLGANFSSMPPRSPTVARRYRAGSALFLHHEDVGDPRAARPSRFAPRRPIPFQTTIVVSPGYDLDFDLTDADGLDDHPRLADRVEHAHRLRRREREPTEMTARRHRADEHAGIRGVPLHPHPVAEDRTAAERAARIDREHADLELVLAHARDERVGEGRLAGARRAGDPDRPRAPRVRMQAAHYRTRTLAALLDERQQLGRRDPITGQRLPDERAGGILVMPASVRAVYRLRPSTGRRRPRSRRGRDP